MCIHISVYVHVCAYMYGIKSCLQEMFQNDSRETLVTMLLRKVSVFIFVHVNVYIYGITSCLSEVSENKKCETFVKLRLRQVSVCV